MSTQSKLFIAGTAAIGIALIAFSLATWTSADPVRFVCYLAIALLASGMKVTLPGVDGTMSVNFFFIFVGVLELSLPEALLLGCTSALLQSYLGRRRRPEPSKVLFNVCSMMAPAVTLAYLAYHGLGPLTRNSVPLLLIAAAIAFFLANTLPIAMVISLTEHKSFRKTWIDSYFWSFPHYIVGAGVAGLVGLMTRRIGWQMLLLVLPAIYLLYRSYRLYFGRVEAEKKHMADMNALHLRTIEALAQAIEAKDHTTHDHVQRVGVYALEIGKDLALSADELEALRAASILHDIGKLAVPEFIINKPGRLTPEEFEKMKIHPVVGAEILETVNFPYPVAPIVRAHHEKWDGSGYPAGIKGEDIPIGARILSAVDCLDALASDRQYRRALPLDQAMDHVAKLSGKDFDPRVVDVLKRRYIELEKLAQSAPVAEPAKLSLEVKIERGEAPDAGFEKLAAAPAVAQETNYLASIAAARQEAQMLFEISHELGSSLSLDETLSLLCMRLKKLVPYDCVAVYLRDDEKLVPRYVNGDNHRLFAALEIPLGQGLSGWVAMNSKPIINGNPSVEPGYLNDATKFTTMRSALAVPLQGVNGVVGVLTLYCADGDVFSKDHLRILLAVSSKVALAITNALKYEKAENSATIDFLTGLPNARSLFMHLDKELARCKRDGSALGVMVCDLDGFKQINDCHGHLVGNRVLQQFAQALRNTCREYDYVGRMGGDEFVIIAPGMKMEAAKEKAAHLAQLARETGRAVCGDKSLGASVGVACFVEDGQDAEQLLAEADRRMYLAKQVHHQEAPTHAADTAAVTVSTAGMTVN